MLRTGERAVPQHHAEAVAESKAMTESQAVWAAMEAEPGFRERLTKAIRDMDRGLAVPYREFRRKRRKAISERRSSDGT